MTSCRPSRRTSFPSLGDTTVALVFRSQAAECAAEAWSWSPGISGREFAVETTGSPTFLGNPDCALALLSDPGRTAHQAIDECIGAAPASSTSEGSRDTVFRGSITRLRHWLSTLRRPGYPDTTQDSLPAAGQTLPDGLAYPQGSTERFQSVSYISSSFPKLAWRNGRVLSQICRNDRLFGLTHRNLRSHLRTRSRETDRGTLFAPSQTAPVTSTGASKAVATIPQV